MSKKAFIEQGHHHHDKHIQVEQKAKMSVQQQTLAQLNQKKQITIKQEINQQPAFLQKCHYLQQQFTDIQMARLQKVEQKIAGIDEKINLRIDGIEEMVKVIKEDVKKMIGKPEDLKNQNSSREMKEKQIIKSQGLQILKEEKIGLEEMVDKQKIKKAQQKQHRLNIKSQGPLLKQEKQPKKDKQQSFYQNYKTIFLLVIGVFLGNIFLLWMWSLIQSLTAICQEQFLVTFLDSFMKILLASVVQVFLLYQFEFNQKKTTKQDGLDQKRKQSLQNNKKNGNWWTRWTKIRDISYKYRYIFCFVLAFLYIILVPAFLEISRLNQSHLCKYMIQLNKLQKQNFQQDIIKTQAVTKIQNNIRDYIDFQPYTKILLIQGYPGVGKSTAVKNFIAQEIYHEQQLALYFNYETITKQTINDFRPFYLAKNSNLFKAIKKIDLPIIQLRFKEQKFQQLIKNFIRIVLEKREKVVLILDQINDLYHSKQFVKFSNFLYQCAREFEPNFKVVIVSTSPKITGVNRKKYQKIQVKKNKKSEIINFLSLLNSNHLHNKLGKQIRIKQIISKYSNSFRQAYVIAVKCVKKCQTLTQKCIQRLIKGEQQQIEKIIKNINDDEKSFFFKKKFSFLEEEFSDNLAKNDIIYGESQWHSKIVQIAVKLIQSKHKQTLKKARNKPQRKKNKIK